MGTVLVGAIPCGCPFHTSETFEPNLSGFVSSFIELSFLKESEIPSFRTSFAYHCNLLILLIFLYNDPVPS